jgi:hypothetical protein
LKIKIRRIEVGIPINIRKTLKFYMVSENSRGEERKEGGETLSATNRATIDHMHSPNRKITS